MRGEFTIYGGMLALILLLMMNPGTWEPVPVSLLNVKRTPLRYQCEECNKIFVSHQAFASHSHKHIGLKRKAGDLPDSIIVELSDEGDMDAYESAIASNLEKVFKEYERGYQYMIETVVNVRHGSPSHTETSSCVTPWYNFRRINTKDVRTKIDTHVMQFSLKGCSLCHDVTEGVDVNIQSTKIHIKPLYIKHGKIECEKCKKSFDERYIDTHFKVCDGGRYCSCCKKFFVKITTVDFNNHCLQCSIVKNSCKTCGMGFNTASSKANHEKKCTNHPSSSASSRNVPGPSDVSSNSPSSDKPNVGIPFHSTLCDTPPHRRPQY